MVSPADRRTLDRRRVSRRDLGVGDDGTSGGGNQDALVMCAGRVLLGVAKDLEWSRNVQQLDAVVDDVDDAATELAGGFGGKRGHNIIYATDGIMYQ